VIPGPQAIQVRDKANQTLVAVAAVQLRQLPATQEVEAIPVKGRASRIRGAVEVQPRPLLAIQEAAAIPVKGRASRIRGAVEVQPRRLPGTRARVEIRVKGRASRMRVAVEVPLPRHPETRARVEIRVKAAASPKGPAVAEGAIPVEGVVVTLSRLNRAIPAPAATLVRVEESRSLRLRYLRRGSRLNFLLRHRVA
jgi:hypothetical protein